MPAIRPIRFSALKALNPLHQEKERGEYHDRQADIDHIGHRALPRVACLRRHGTAGTGRFCLPMQDPCEAVMIPNRTHAASPARGSVRGAMIFMCRPSRLATPPIATWSV